MGETLSQYSPERMAELQRPSEVHPVLLNADVELCTLVYLGEQIPNELGELVVDSLSSDEKEFHLAAFNVWNDRCPVDSEDPIVPFESRNDFVVYIGSMLSTLRSQHPIRALGLTLLLIEGARANAYERSVDMVRGKG